MGRFFKDFMRDIPRGGQQPVWVAPRRNESTKAAVRRYFLAYVS